MGVAVQFADEEWQRIQFGGVEGYWGLFHDKCVSLRLAWLYASLTGLPFPPPSSRTLKGITIPSC